MPIKFKCKCGKVLSVPSKMAGKQGKCPACSNALKVPTPKAPAGQPAASPKSGGSKPSQAKPGAAKANSPKPAPKAAASLGAMDDLLNDAGIVEQKGPVCKQCGADIKPGNIVCTSCGLNFETGETTKGFDAQGVDGPEFDNAFLQQASDNMQRDVQMESRRDKASMPWWVLMSYLIGTLTLCLAGVTIVDGQFGEPDPATTFIGRVQRLSVFQVLGTTALVTGIAITSFAHMSICFFGFTRSVGQGIACLFLPLLYSVVYGIMNWKENKAPVKAIISAVIFIGFGIFLIMQGGGFGKLQNLL